jgi:CheY-like chemotaxis protein/REP element-mobilizing transposase RayT
MPRSILIVDANPGFAGMLEQAFTGAGFTCAPALTAEEAVRIASSQPIDLAIVDFHVPDASVRDLIRALRALQPSAILLGIPLDNNPDNPLLDELGMQGGLFKPFYLPSLIPYIARILGEEMPASVAPDELPPAPPEDLSRPPTHRSTRSFPWLNDPGYLAEVLDQTAAANPVVACMVTRGTQLCAWAGALTRDQLSLVARKVAESWSDSPGGTLARYIHVPLMASDVYLYSTSLSIDLDLTILFDPKTPLSVTRQRALNFLKALERNPESSLLQGDSSAGERRSLAETSLPFVSADEESDQREGSLQNQIDTLFARNRIGADEYPPSQRKPVESPARIPIAPKKRGAGLEPFVAAPLATRQETGGMRAEIYDEKLQPDEAYPDEPTRRAVEDEHSGEDGREVAFRQVGLSDRAVEESGIGQFDQTLDGATAQAETPAHLPRRSLSHAMERRLRKEVFRFDNAPPPNPVPLMAVAESTGPEPVARPTMEDQPRIRIEALPVDSGLADRAAIPAGFEAPSPALVKLAYAIVLTPTFPGARLTPEMAADLETFIRNVSVSYGWKALRIVVQSGFLAVNISAPPHVAPAFVIRVLRRHSSQCLLERFPALADSNVSPDFWAPGYLLIGTDQPPTPQQVTDYIAFTRRAQGFGPGSSANG